MNIGVFGGSFDPIHKAHIKIVEKSLRKLPIQKMVVVPAFLNPFKSSFSALPQIRAKWVSKAFKKYKNVEVLLYEIKKNRVCYTYEVIDYLKKKYKPKKIYFIIGADNLSKISRWKNYKKLKKELSFVVASRENIKIPISFLKIKVNYPISSTFLRKKPQRKFLPPLLATEITKFYQSLPKQIAKKPV
jgi:nicotinate-nucleotide adenylyltransferase